MQTCSPGESCPSFQTARLRLNVNVRMKGQSDHHLSPSVWRMTSPITESSTCPFSCWQLDGDGVNVSKSALICGKPSKVSTATSLLFSMPNNKISLKKPFIWNVKISEPLHLGLHYHNLFIILSVHLLWCKPPRQEEMVATEDLKYIYIDKKLVFIRNGEELGRNLHRTLRASQSRYIPW